MIIIDAFLRFSGVGMLLFIGALTLRDLRSSNCSFYLLLACISTASHFLGFTPKLFQSPYEFQLLFRFLDVPMLLFIWLFTLSLFQKDFKLTLFHLIVGAIYCISIFVERLFQFGFINHLPLWWALQINTLSIIIIVQMITITLKERTDDLIEIRRKSRIYLVLMIAFSSTLMIVFSFIFLVNENDIYQPTANIFSIWPAIIWLSYWLVDIKENKFSFDVDKIINTFNSRDLDLQKKLNIEIIKNQCFLENKLSIGLLSKRLGVSAYRLRIFINQKLGYNNFSSYINTFRIDAIKQAFLNPKNSHLPILTIAMNHGFNSLAPFNRAFKSIEDITPSEFRRKIK